MEDQVAGSFQTLDTNSELAQKVKDDEFFNKAKEKARRVKIGGREFFVLEGDLLLDEVQLAEYALEKKNGAQQPVAEAEVGGKPSKLLGIGKNGKLVRWKPGVVLSYFVAKETFPQANQYTTAREAMRTATEDWMQICGVVFEYKPALDTNPAARPGGALFSVSLVDAGGDFIAAAFFPDDPPARRAVVIDPSFFSATLGFDRVGVLRHELGHVLGFRHEHIRSEAPAGCPNEPLFGTIKLTDYDPRSVMHYFCGAVGSQELKITDVDKSGSQRLYGLPLSSFHFVS